MGDPSNLERINKLVVEALTFNKPMLYVLLEAQQLNVEVVFVPNEPSLGFLKIVIADHNQYFRKYLSVSIDPNILRDSSFYPATSNG